MLGKKCDYFLSMNARVHWAADARCKIFGTKKPEGCSGFLKFNVYNITIEDLSQDT